MNESSLTFATSDAEFRRSQYGAFNTALRSLYKDDILQLANEKKQPFEFNDKLFEDAASLVYDNGGFDISLIEDPAARAVINETLRVLSIAIDSGLPHEVPETVRYALENNAFVFSGFKTFHSMREIGLSMVTDKGDIKPFNDFLADAKKINQQYNHNYLYAEYNHAVGTSLMAAKWHEFEQDGDRYNLQYRTAGDNHVREEHALLHGTTLPPSDPFWDKYYPPNGWNCRCTVEQVLKDKYPLSDADLAMKRGDNCTDGVKRKMFRYNPGKTMELFPPKHPYRKAPAEAEKGIFYLARNNARKNAVEVLRKSSNLQTGELHQTRKAMQRAIGHAFNLEELNAIISMPDNLDTFHYERFSPLGEVKNMDDPKDINNIQKKQKRGVTGYNIYFATINGVEWVVKTEVFKNKGVSGYFRLVDAIIKNKV